MKNQKIAFLFRKVSFKGFGNSANGVLCTVLNGIDLHLQYCIFAYFAQYKNIKVIFYVPR